MMRRIAQALWGKFESRQELQKFGILALIFFCIIGTYWALRPLKESVFATTVGIDLLPFAKILSIGFIIPLVLLYSKLIEFVSHKKIFYMIIGLYGLLALLFTYFLMHPLYGLANTVESPTRLVGWFFYVFVESFGSMAALLFWVIVTDITLPEPAKRGFPVIYLFGQLGNFSGPWLLRASRLGFSTSAPIVGICGFLIFLTGFLMWFFMHITPEEQLKGYEGKEEEQKTGKPKASFLEGLRLLVTNWYLMGILIIISVYEIIVVGFDYLFHVMARAQFAQEVILSDYLAQYAVWTGLVAMLCVLFGINNIQRRLGMLTTLVLTPLLVAAAAVFLKFNPYLSVAFWIMVLAKAVNYSLNQPTIKQLYIPVQKKTRYKAQGWFETFGARGAKSIGSTINLARFFFVKNYGLIAGAGLFLTMSTMVSLGLVAGWLFVALYIARGYNEAIKKNEFIA